VGEGQLRIRKVEKEGGRVGFIGETRAEAWCGGTGVGGVFVAGRSAAPRG
jgi:hypothetical protein